MYYGSVEPCCEWLLLYEPITIQQIGLKRSFLWRGAQIIGSEIIQTDDKVFPK